MYMDIDIDMEHGHRHAVWTWTCSTDMDTQHSLGHAAWIWQWTCMDAGMPINVQSGIVSFPLVYDALSGIGFPASLSVQYC
jgi:hypothetical protein